METNKGTPVTSRYKDYEVHRCPECDTIIKLPKNGDAVVCSGCGEKWSLAEE